MKTTKSALLVGTALLAAVASSQTTVGSDIVGYTKITMPAAGWLMVGHNFDAGSEKTLYDVFGTNQLSQHNYNPGLCDQVILWNTNTLSYQAWAQKTNGIFYKANDMGQFISGNTGTVSEITVKAGMGMWLVNSGAQKTIIFSGNVVSAQTQMVSIASGWQILSYPLTCSSTISETDLVKSGAATHNYNPGLCDQIIRWEGSSYQAYAPKTNGIWYKANSMGEFLAGTPATNPVPTGEGFWYVAQNSISWAESNKYYGVIQ